jgi:hypothetical protein
VIFIAEVQLLVGGVEKLLFLKIFGANVPSHPMVPDGLFPRGRAGRNAKFILTSVYCPSQGCMEIYLHVPIYPFVT